MRLISLLLLTLSLSMPAFSQDSSVVYSDPIDISDEGLNKLLLLKNGNTLLFHFESKKGIVIKIFNSKHNEILSKKYNSFSKLSTYKLGESRCENILEIKGETVVFISQRAGYKKKMIRLRFDSQTGTLKHEDDLYEALNYLKKGTGYLYCNPDSETYSILTCERKSVDTSQVSITFIKYNSSHQITKSIPVHIDYQYPERVEFIGSGHNNTGALVLVFRKVNYYVPKESNIVLQLLYLPVGSDSFSKSDFNLQAGFSPSRANCTFNGFAGTINIFLESVASEARTSGKHTLAFDYIANTLMVVNEDLTAPELKAINEDKISAYLKTNSYSGRFNGEMLSRNTNRRGLTTMVSVNQNIFQSDKEYDDFGLFSGDFGITQLDDHGNEIWGAVFPTGRVYKQALYQISGIPIFNTLEEYCLYTKASILSNDNCYLLFNELDENFNKKLGDAFTPISDIKKTNAMYYQVDKRKKISKKYLFGEPTKGIYQQAFLGGMDYDKDKGICTLVMSIQKGEGRTNHIAWVQLGN